MKTLSLPEYHAVIVDQLKRFDATARRYAVGREMERRAARGDASKFKAAMEQVPDVPPMPGDEI